MSEGVTNNDPHEPGREPQTSNDEDGIGLLDFAIVLAKHKKVLVGLPLAAALIAIAFTLSKPDIYTGNTKVLPPPTRPTAQLDALAGLTGGIPGLRSPTELYVGMLKSRTVADKMIERFDLNKIYGQNRQSNTRRQLEGVTQIITGKDGIIVIEVDDKDPKLAAALANGYVEELIKFTTGLAITAASQRRRFLEQQHAQVRESLSKAEKAAYSALEKGGLANVDAQSRGMLELTARLRAQISAKEIEISAMRAFATDQNADLLRNQQELVAMRRQLAGIEGATDPRGKGQDAPDARGLENVRLLREVKYYEILNDLLAKHYELARIDEASTVGVIEVIDRAIEPDRKSKPNRRRTVLLTTFIAGLLGVLWAFLVEATERARKNPHQVERWRTLKNHLWTR
jgi:tyrosine-protein kinase Etk/Wzc